MFSRGCGFLPHRFFSPGTVKKQVDKARLLQNTDSSSEQSYLPHFPFNILYLLAFAYIQHFFKQRDVPEQPKYSSFGSSSPRHSGDWSQFCNICFIYKYKNRVCQWGTPTRHQTAMPQQMSKKRIPWILGLFHKMVNPSLDSEDVDLSQYLGCMSGCYFPKLRFLCTASKIIYDSYFLLQTLSLGCKKNMIPGFCAERLPFPSRKLSSKITGNVKETSDPTLTFWE